MNLLHGVARKSSFVIGTSRQYSSTASLCYWKVKNFLFMKSRGGSEVAIMKIAFFAIFDPTWTNILAPADPNMGFNFSFQSLRKTEAILLPIM